MARRTFLPGHQYLAAGDVPFVVPYDAIESDLAEQGFHSVRIWDAEDVGPLPFPATGEYNTVGVATFGGAAPRELEVPDDIVMFADITTPSKDGPRGTLPVVSKPAPQAPPRWWVPAFALAGVAVVTAGALWWAEST